MREVVAEEHSREVGMLDFTTAVMSMNIGGE